jgi:Reverse transcriptase (RNA-dependent DNA polymerase)/Endonuclease-reverse transcriptase
MNGKAVSYPVLHAIHVLFLSVLSLGFLLSLSCPYLHSATHLPATKLLCTSLFPPSSLHPSLDGSCAILLASHSFQPRSFMYSTRPSFFSRNRFALLVYFSLLLSGDIQLNPGPSNPFTISFSTLNIRSASTITSDLDKPELLQNFILDKSIEILALTETWLSPDTPPSVLNSLTPPNFSLFHKPRSTGRGGGLAVIHRSYLKITEASLPIYSSFESLGFTLALPSKTLYFLTVYRPPSSSISSFLEDFSELLSNLRSKPSDLIISGDFNIHIDNSSPSALSFLTLLDSFGLIQFVNFPTHELGQSLDLLISSSESLVSNVHPYFPAISDHDAVLATLSVPCKIRPSRVIKTIRPLRKIDPAAFSQDILSSALYTLPSLDPTSYLNEFNSVISSLIDKHAPARAISCPSAPHKPFITPEIRAAKAKRSRLETIYRRSHSPTALANFKDQAKIVTKLISASRRDFFRQEIASNVNKPRKLWTSLNNLLNRTTEPKLPSSIPSSALPSAFLNLFNGKISKLRSSLQASLSSPHISPPVTPPILSSFSPTTTDEVRRIILSLPDSSCSLDIIPTFLLKSCLDALLPPITTFLNLCLAESKFPSLLKHAMITPLLKKSNLPSDDLSNYRPISNLTFLSKVLERLILIRLHKHLSTFSSIPTFQSGYRKFHSTETALLRIHNDLLLEIENQRVSCLILLDLSAAFDTVDHKILLSRLSSNFGVTSSAHSLLTSYLSDRTQSVHIGSSQSSSSPLHTGVPQGSVLGPLLFTLYTTPLSYLLKNSGVSYHMYADDTQLYFSFSATDSLPNLSFLSGILDSVHSWLSSNYLSLNPSKTEFLLIGTSQQRSRITSDLLSFSGNIISPSTSARNLGIIFEPDLSLSKQISSVCRRSYHSIRLLRQIRSSLDQNTAVLLANSLVSSNLDYCNSLYYALPERSLHRLQLVQNSLARAVLPSFKKYDHITPALRELHWLPIHKRIHYKVCLLTYKSLHSLAPTYISELLKTYNPARNLRSSDASLLSVPLMKSCSGRRSFSFAAPTLWNSLPLLLRRSPSLSSFRASLKTFLYPP